ncbi:hypothetical protein [Enterococcus lemanii]|uniref:DUF4440 domain-containing protein n=1 Tax=Enterococcus lemanii TaxID=1159752 RepID=A0ABV9MXT5_9ENTE|nr:hypothetical protein [Enterococcus lemanii]MBM7709988.1 uncharacterized protein YchJ [Enterococcus lemanii]NLM66144.1 hypothetical protein [Enterococcus sp.]
MLKKGFIAVAGLLFLVLIVNYFNQAQEITDNIQQEAGQVEITGKIKDETQAQAALAVLQTNLTAANEKDLALYIQTLVPEAREATKSELEKTFAEYDLEHTLLSFEVMKQTDDLLQVKTQQKTINLGKNKYRNHITEAHHTFVKEDGQWLIKEVSMSNTQFI